MYTDDMKELKQAIYTAKLQQLKEQDNKMRDATHLFKYSKILGTYDDEIEPLDELYYAREIESKKKQTNKPLAF